MIYIPVSSTQIHTRAAQNPLFQVRHHPSSPLIFRKNRPNIRHVLLSLPIFSILFLHHFLLSPRFPPLPRGAVGAKWHKHVTRLGLEDGDVGDRNHLPRPWRGLGSGLVQENLHRKYPEIIGSKSLQTNLKFEKSLNRFFSWRPHQNQPMRKGYMNGQKRWSFTSLTSTKTIRT